LKKLRNFVQSSKGTRFRLRSDYNKSRTVRVVTYSLTGEDSLRLERLLSTFGDSFATSESGRFRSFLREVEKALIASGFHKEHGQ
jgi:hypothetical protein